MIHFLCALYEEAQFLIETFQLKKNPAIHAFPVYESREDNPWNLRLTLTGTGAVSAATAVGYIAALDAEKEESLLINVGSCGGGTVLPVGTVILGNKLVEETTGRCYYPDILFSHPFRETEIHTSAKIASPEKLAQMETAVLDMEAAAIYQAGSRFYSPHQMVFLKVVSDHGIRENGQAYQPGTLHKVLSNAGDGLVPFFRGLLEEQEESPRREPSVETERLKEELHCSVTMAAEVEQLMRYVNLAGVELSTLLEADRRAGRLPCKDKKEGKGYLAQLKRRVL